MEFLIDSPNIQIKAFDAINSSQLDPLLIYKYSKISLEQLNKKLYYLIFNNKKFKIKYIIIFSIKNEHIFNNEYNRIFNKREFTVKEILNFLSS